MDEHPSNLMIVEKARKRGTSSSDGMGVAQNGRDASSRKAPKRKRSPDELALNIGDDVIDLAGSDSDVRLQSSGAEDSDQVEIVPERRAPVGVTVIGDDEEEVQLGMQKAMRMPRYFTQRTFAGSSKKCFNCGQQGHFNRDCPNKRQERPCFLCAKYGHTDMRCPASKVRCYKCNRLGHLSRECPYPQNSLAIPMVCTRCGDPDCSASGQPDWVRAEGGCAKQYSRADLDVIRCYVCGSKGHLSCKKTTAIAAFPYCFNCGLEGHLGIECSATPTHQVTMEKREVPNQRGLDELRSGDSHSSEARHAKRARKDDAGSSYWQDNAAADRPALGAPYYPPQLHMDSNQYRYNTLPPVQHPKAPPPQFHFQNHPLQGQQYGQVQFQQIPNSNFGQALPPGGFTMGYAPPPHAGQRHYPRNGRRR